MKKRIRKKIIKRAVSKMRHGEALTAQEQQLVAEMIAWAHNRVVDRITQTVRAVAFVVGEAFIKAREEQTT